LEQVQLCLYSPFARSSFVPLVQTLQFFYQSRLPGLYRVFRQLLDLEKIFKRSAGKAVAHNFSLQEAIVVPVLLGAAENLTLLLLTQKQKNSSENV